VILGQKSPPAIEMNREKVERKMTANPNREKRKRDQSAKVFY
jgi:hypothetical protein